MFVPIRLRSVVPTLLFSLAFALVPSAPAQTQLSNLVTQSAQSRVPATPSIASGLSPVSRLEPDASFVQGCFPPCLCPLQLGTDLRGTFELQPLPTADPLFRTFAVRQVNWLVRLGGLDQRVTGSGIYRVASLPSGPLQELVLDLEIDDSGVAMRFDSGLVPGGQRGRYPAIDVQIDADDLSCFDTLIHVRARSVPRNQILDHRLAASSTYQEGCLDPCDCLLYQERSVAGRFALVRIFREANAVEFGVVELEWAIAPGAPSPLPAASPVRGSGVLRVEGPFGSLQHRLLLDLAFDGLENRWDSGLVPGPALPLMDIDLGINGFMCFERVFSLQAAPF